MSRTPRGRDLPPRLFRTGPPAPEHRPRPRVGDAPPQSDSPAPDAGPRRSPRAAQPLVSDAASTRGPGGVRVRRSQRGGRTVPGHSWGGRRGDSGRVERDNEKTHCERAPGCLPGSVWDTRPDEEVGQNGCARGRGRRGRGDPSRETSGTPRRISSTPDRSGRLSPRLPPVLQVPVHAPVSTSVAPSPPGASGPGDGVPLVVRAPEVSVFRLGPPVPSGPTPSPLRARTRDLTVPGGTGPSTPGVPAEVGRDPTVGQEAREGGLGRQVAGAGRLGEAGGARTGNLSVAR